MALRDATRNIERTLGRTTKSKDGHYADRIIDIDILFYGDRIVNTATLTIPHRAIAQREFVLRPLMDIAPDFLHPTLHLSVRELMDNLQKNSAK
jgi:2-amino-4-hydroxy-6-hydroxymethyldihydropteridine diphosphokinase